MQTDPLKLLNRANNGDKEAYHQLLVWLTQHCKCIIKLTVRNYRNFPHEAVEDITQEIMIAFHEVHQSFDLTRPFLPWINSIIRHKTVDFLRKKDFRVLMNSQDIFLVSETMAKIDELCDSDPLDLEHLMKNLSQTEVDIIRMAKIDGHSSKEIAQQLNLSDSNVKVIIYRTIKKLKALNAFLKK